MGFERLVERPIAVVHRLLLIFYSYSNAYPQAQCACVLALYVPTRASYEQWLEEGSRHNV